MLSPYASEFTQILTHKVLPAIRVQLYRVPDAQSCSETRNGFRSGTFANDYIRHHTVFRENDDVI